MASGSFFLRRRGGLWGGFVIGTILTGETGRALADHEAETFDEPRRTIVTRDPEALSTTGRERPLGGHSANDIVGALVAGAWGSRIGELPVGDHQSSPSRRRVAGVPAFVAAKIATPSGGFALIRPAVLAKLSEGAERRLLIVRAPAGYGKTVVVAEASRRLGWRAAWYRLDVLDHDPAVLIASLVQTIREPVPGFGAILLERFAEAHEVPMSPSEMTALLVSELRDEVDGDLHIVIDDYHQAIASAELNRTLDYLLANAPPHVHLVLLTRYQPAIATTRLKLDDQIVELSFEDLRLDAEQVVELFAARSRAGLARAQARRLVGLTEGWPASLVLISRALDWTNLGSIEHALVDPRLTSDVFSYLSEEAFRREDAETVAFLLATCCLESMTVELADKVARADHAQRSLERLVAHNVFTFVDRATGTYRYHQLLRDYLRQWYVNEYGAGAFRDLQIHTAGAVEDAGDPETAIELYLAANEPGEALAVVSRSGELVTDNCRFDSLRSWLDRLAPYAPHDDPWVLFLRGQAGVARGRFVKGARRPHAGRILISGPRRLVGRVPRSQRDRGHLVLEGRPRASGRSL